MHLPSHNSIPVDRSSNVKRRMPSIFAQTNKQRDSLCQNKKPKTLEKDPKIGPPGCQKRSVFSWGGGRVLWWCNPHTLNMRYRILKRYPKISPKPVIFTSNSYTALTLFLDTSKIFYRKRSGTFIKFLQKSIDFHKKSQEAMTVYDDL